MEANLVESLRISTVGSKVAVYRLYKEIHTPGHVILRHHRKLSDFDFHPKLVKKQSPPLVQVQLWNLAPAQPGQQ